MNYNVHPAVDQSESASPRSIRGRLLDLAVAACGLAVRTVLAEEMTLPDIAKASSSANCSCNNCTRARSATVRRWSVVLRDPWLLLAVVMEAWRIFSGS